MPLSPGRHRPSSRHTSSRDAGGLTPPDVGYCVAQPIDVIVAAAPGVRRKEQDMYIGVGTLLVILIIVLLIVLL